MSSQEPGPPSLPDKATFYEVQPDVPPTNEQLEKYAEQELRLRGLLAITAVAAHVPTMVGSAITIRAATEAMHGVNATVDLIYAGIGMISAALTVRCGAIAQQQLGNAWESNRAKLRKAHGLPYDPMVLKLLEIGDEDNKR